ncbi:MAG: hypothetical protein JXR30_00305 [Alphaproteobacteria bacterium]|nr:hypothetical protein [Alphaproteobacteria bacterium]
MEKLKSSLNELRTVLIDLQTVVVSKPTTGSLGQDKDLEQKCRMLEHKQKQIEISLSSIIRRLETALKE